MGRSNYENQPKDKNPYGAEVNTSGKSTSKDAQERFNAERGLTGPAEVNAATGPNISSTIDRLTSGNFSADTTTSRKEKERRESLRDGASGQALLDSADDHEKNAKLDGKYSVAQGKLDMVFRPMVMK